jgi:prepilin-type N-terminal cleavage/methylation domain-containing protein
VTRRLRSLRLGRGEGGYTLTEMLMVMVIMSIVMAALTDFFIAGTKAEADQDRRFQAQLSARLALDKLRRDIHCAYDVTPNTPNPWTSAQTSVTLKNTGCSGGDVTWCTAAVAGYSNRWTLYRQMGTSCSAGTGIKVAEYLTASAPFTSFAHATGCQCKASLGVSIAISVKGTAVGAYRLDDTIYLRNSTRI